jgi:hypothetical protein
MIDAFTFTTRGPARVLQLSTAQLKSQVWYGHKRGGKSPPLSASRSLSTHIALPYLHGRAASKSSLCHGGMRIVRYVQWRILAVRQVVHQQIMTKTIADREVKMMRCRGEVREKGVSLWPRVTWRFASMRFGVTREVIPVGC